jgi:hypothetical protein
LPTGSLGGVTTLAGVPHVSRMVDVDGPVHYLDYGGPEGAPVLIGVHGLGGSHLNWAAVSVPVASHRPTMTSASGW